jgi:hypothetical protein
MDTLVSDLKAINFWLGVALYFFTVCHDVFQDLEENETCQPETCSLSRLFFVH